MKMIAHRGYWKKAEERNTYFALERALNLGLGFETDLRDYCGQLVISHNVPDENCVPLEKLFDVYSKLKTDVTLALNVKADGIQVLLKSLLDKYRIMNYFVFDMSIPEQVVYDEQGFRVFSRQSDIEPQCVMYNKAEGVWIDTFYDENWLDVSKIQEHLSGGKRVCIVSSELHGRPHERLWEMLKDLKDCDQLLLCTDIPDEARRYFEY